MIRVSAFRWVPPAPRGLVRDLRVRWALEEAGLSYEERLIGLGDRASPDYRALQPFGQVPVYEEDGLSLFESGAIVLHIAERSTVLLPADPDARARAKTWMFAALNTIEAPVQDYATLDMLHGGEPWVEQRRPALRQFAERRLDELAAALAEEEYLDGAFSAADLLMTSVLRILRDDEMIVARPTLHAYRSRCEARPAFARALAAQLAAFERNDAPG